MVMLLTLLLTSCRSSNKNEGEGEGGGGGSDGGWQMPEDEYRIPMEDGYNQLTFYWSHPGVIEDCDIWCWWDGKVGDSVDVIVPVEAVTIKDKSIDIIIV